ncbi:MAG: M3 family metallopeptidase [Alphaproteobacteria bacterium]|uniref:M3 family metallopeptidase n=1 Tax=Brevundimonas sp. TaxID=1871086 RepID=UPI0017D2AC37|nr:M3 family metallopeptidase [Brevundimonas sp.]MBA3049821.1 M3 family metallopeptidase [Brevundimonas sp.]MBU3971272.1 M3 family metallopeptidase [Alphaproteobacteria bacterium]MBU4039517.1 M3 family metallopeptidase [Alphaproteobacteria bacterium]MBU4134914.1 M3 family metallopeptidase [Alphaproteobacteria bacterium]
MHRRQLLVAGGSLLALSACASNGMSMGGGSPGATLEADAAAARAVLPAQTPRAELLQAWTGPYGGTPPWDRVTAAKLREALLEGIELQRAEIQAIANNPAPPTFANTLVALQMAGEPLDRAGSIYGVMTSNIGSDDYNAVDTELSPLLSAAGDEITFNEKLFVRIKAVADGAAAAGLTAEQTRLAERSRDAFVRNGAALNPAGKAELGRINTALANAFTAFSQKVVADENTWTVIPNEAGVAGLPDSNKAAAAAAARSRNVEGWAIVNTRSSVDPFLSFADDRGLREVVWRKFVNRGDNGDANDTNAIIAEIVKLRQERARLLGFGNHAEWRMQDTMAKTPQAAMDLMNRVWAPAKARVAEEVADMRALAGHDIEPWDYLYYAEKVRKQKYDLDQNELKPYFELNNVRAGSFEMARRLYGFTFEKLAPGTVSVFHPDVTVYEVKDAGRPVGLYYTDDYARAGKRSGAWMTTYRSHSTYDGDKNTLGSNNNNFIKAEGAEPILISLDDAETMFHEFGHALHAFSSKVTYPALGGTPRDYVEYPSQVHEHWVLSRPILDGYMKHYRTGEPMPQALVDKIEAAATFNQGYATVSYLSSALVDMDLHTQTTPPTDIDAFERESLARYGMPKEIVMRHRLPQFNHLFTSDSYSAGYYSYLWSEVMDADTWAYFEESGDVFNPDIASRYKAIILAEGNTTDRAEAYRRFRGRDPDVSALLKVRGFPTS